MPNLVGETDFHSRGRHQDYLARPRGTVAYVRTKTIKGIDYSYLVEGVREGGKARQRVIKYLGRTKK